MNKVTATYTVDKETQTKQRFQPDNPTGDVVGSLYIPKTLAENVKKLRVTVEEVS